MQRRTTPSRLRLLSLFGRLLRLFEQSLRAFGDLRDQFLRFRPAGLGGTAGRLNTLFDRESFRCSFATFASEFDSGGVLSCHVRIFTIRFYAYMRSAPYLDENTPNIILHDAQRCG